MTDTPHHPNGAVSTPDHARLVEVLGRLGAHDHLCLIYETQAEQFAAVIPFMRLGLARGEQCLYIADDNTASAVLDAMRAGGINVDAAVASGALTVATKRETYLKHGYFDPDAMIRLLTEATRAAKAAGFSALRATGEMTWMLGGDPGAERLMEYEAKLNYFFPHHDALAICQYNRSRFSNELILDVIRTHPMVIYGGTVGRNFYYVPPDEFLSANQPSREVQRLLDNIRDREHAEEELAIRARQQSAVAELGLQALGSTGLDELMHTATACVAQTLGVECCKVLELLLRAGVGWKEGLVGRATVSTGLDSQAGYTLASAHPVIVEDLRTETRFCGPPLLHEHGVVSGLGVALPGRDQPWGVLGAHTTRLRRFSEDDVHFLQAVANVLAEAVRRQQAEEALRQLNEELERRVTERTAQLEAANKELEAFSYSVSHDLRGPLRLIDGVAQLVMEDHAPQLPAECQLQLQGLRTSTRRMGDLIDALLTFSRLSRQPLNKQTVACTSLVRECLEELRTEREGRQVEIRVGELPDCQADPALLRQVVLNLLSNALKYTRPRAAAVIEIGCQQIGDERAYFVRDNGVGFNMKQAHRLFRVFQRLHRAEEHEGTGVGLAIVQRIIHRHGGRVWAEAAVDQGATFYFTVEGASRAASQPASRKPGS
ncbi:MAG: MEDS domain-containing protein [Verrucomicrobia bacterium]|nr:MEDS domain-containing protein [Verrucomicrobiota bacterium]